MFVVLLLLCCRRFVVLLVVVALFLFSSCVPWTASYLMMQFRLGGLANKHVDGRWSVFVVVVDVDADVDVLFQVFVCRRDRSLAWPTQTSEAF